MLKARKMQSINLAKRCVFGPTGVPYGLMGRRKLNPPIFLPKTERKKNKPGQGRKPTPIDWEELKELGKFHCTANELAGWVGMDPTHLSARCEREQGITLDNFIESNKGQGKLSLRRTLYLRATSGEDTTALIYACKHHLGMHDRVTAEHVGRDGGPLQWVQLVKDELGKP